MRKPHTVECSSTPERDRELERLIATTPAWKACVPTDAELRQIRRRQQQRERASKLSAAAVQVEPAADRH